MSNEINISSFDPQSFRAYFRFPDEQKRILFSLITSLAPDTPVHSIQKLLKEKFTQTPSADLEVTLGILMYLSETKTHLNLTVHGLFTYMEKVFSELEWAEWPLREKAMNDMVNLISASQHIGSITKGGEAQSDTSIMYAQAESPEDISAVFEGIDPVEQYMYTEKIRVAGKRIPYLVKGSVVGFLAEELAFLLPVFQRSESVLSLQNDPEDEPVQEIAFETWASAIRYVIGLATYWYISKNLIIRPPVIYNGPGGSIDVLWETDDYLILVNIHPDGFHASYYAENSDQTYTTRGEFSVPDFPKNLFPIPL